MYIKPLDPHYTHLTLSPWHGGALLGCGCLLSGNGMDLAVNETTVWSVELEPAFTSRAESVNGNSRMYLESGELHVQLIL